MQNKVVRWLEAFIPGLTASAIGMGASAAFGGSLQMGTMGFTGSIGNTAKVSSRALNATQFSAAYQNTVRNQTQRGTDENKRATRDTRGAPEVKYVLNENFADELQEWINNTSEEKRKNDGGWFIVGTTSDALKSIGVRKSSIYWRKYKIGTIMEDHPEMGIETIKKVPELIEEPVVVLKSKTQQDSIVLLGDLIADNGQKVMAAINLTPIPTGGMDAEFSLITSAYGRSDTSVKNLLKDSEYLYLDSNKNRTDSWLMSLGLQLPSGQPTYGSIGSVSYSGNTVKIEGVRIELVSAKNDAKESFSFDDEDYMLAVEAGDMYAAQEMVDEAANKAGFTYRRNSRNVLDPVNGTPWTMYGDSLCIS